MLFKNKDMSVDYMPSKQIEKYLEAKLKKLFDYEYAVFVRLSTSQNWLDITIDETTMTDEMYEKLQVFKDENDLFTDLQVFEQIMKNQYGKHYSFNFLVDDLKGAYVIRKC